MKKLILSLVLAVSLFSQIGYGCELESITGEKISDTVINNDAKAVLFFWTSWCPYCIKQIDYISKNQNIFDDRGIKVYFINSDDSKNVVQSIKDKYSLKFDMYLDDGCMSKKYKVYGIPTYIFLKQGEMIETEHGLDGDMLDEVFE